jgi:hypothetical protein
MLLDLREKAAGSLKQQERLDETYMYLDLAMQLREVFSNDGKRFPLEDVTAAVSSPRVSQSHAENNAGVRVFHRL